MNRVATLTIALSFVAFPVWAQGSAEAPTLDGGETTFEWLGVLSRENGHFSSAHAMTPDGSVVVGKSSSEDGLPYGSPFRWEEGEMEALETLPGWDSTTPYDVSNDGSVIVGRKSPFQAVRWVDGEADVLECIEESSGTRVCPNAAKDVTADGSTMVGWAGVRFPNGVTGLEPFRWTEEEGVVRLPSLPPPPGEHPRSGVEMITADGSVMIGTSETSRGKEAVRWINDEIEVMEGLPTDVFYPASGHGDMTPDGSVIVASRRSRDIEQGFEAIRWEDGELMGLGYLDDADYPGSMALGVSADGSIVVGFGGSDSEDVSLALIWTEAEGMRNLQTVLEEDYGIDLNGSILERATAISDDGTVIVGGGYTSDGLYEAWRVVLGKPVADEATPEAPANVLSAPSPNPVRGSASLTLRVTETQHMSVEVFDAMGRRVQTLYDGALAAGASQPITLDASALPAGVYIVRATGEDPRSGSGTGFTKTRRVTVVR